MARTLIITGLVIVAAGVLLAVGDKIGIRFGKLPGDITMRGKNTVFYFPLATSILLSLLLTFVMWLIGRR